MSQTVGGPITQFYTLVPETTPGPQLLRTTHDLNEFYTLWNIDQSKRNLFEFEQHVILAMIGVKRTNPFDYQFAIEKASVTEENPSLLEVALRDENAANLGGCYTLKPGFPIAFFSLDPQIQRVTLQYKQRGDLDHGFADKLFKYQLG